MTARPQPDLFDMKMSAVFGGPDNRYRYQLHRVWDDGRPQLVVCMLNPSTADHRVNDPTILTLIYFAKLWGYGGLLVVNLFAFRSSSPTALKAADDPVGSDNGRYLVAALMYAGRGGQILAGWGNGGSHDVHITDWFCLSAASLGVTLTCLGTTKNGHPKHPLARGKHRIPRDQQPIVWRKAP